MPVGNLVGEENEGWKLITNQLNHERVTLCSSGIVERHARRRARVGARTRSCADGRRVIDQEWVQLNLARVHARLEFLRLINWKVAWTPTQGARCDPADASAIKVFGTEFYLEAFRLLMEILGPPATLQGRLARRGAARPARAHVRAACIILTFGGGTNEMQRDLIAIFGLGMPGSHRR